jgi:hypothetical protein
MGTASPPASGRASPAHPASSPGAGGQAAQPPTAGPSATGLNPAACHLLTPAEINTVTGLRVGNGKPDVGAGLPGEVSCLFVQQVPSGVRVDLFRRTDSPELFDSLLTTGKPVSGLGDEAKASVGNGTAAIVVRQGSVVVALFVAKTEAPAVTLAGVKNLAAQALGRI